MAELASGFLDKISGTKGAIGNAASEVGEIGGATSGLSTKLTDLAKNMGLGLLILTEAAAAAAIFVGAIWLIGEELQKVGEAWQPVIDNGETIATAVAIGTGLIVAVGAACYALGSLGGTAAANVGIGAAILLELGVATGLFLVEIWAIGKGLTEVGEAWQPVIDNADTIKTAILVGTGLLVGIGVVTAALGAATIATGATLPIAIGLGTAILVELAAAFVAFVESLVAVADELTDNLAPAFDRLNPKIPKLTTDVEDSNNRWSAIYAATGTVSTSDRKEKQDISYDLSKYDALFGRLKPASYRLKNGESGRTHTGMIAQDVEEALTECGLAGKDFAGFVKEKNASGEFYGLRYEEFISLCIRQIQMLNERVQTLEEKLKNTEVGENG